jgi:hypothetical protein
MAAKLTNLTVFYPYKPPITNRLCTIVLSIVTQKMSIIKWLSILNYPQWAPLA